jgi:hypothetical protein
MSLSLRLRCWALCVVVAVSGGLLLDALGRHTPELGPRSSCAAQSCDSEPDLGERTQP